MKHIIMKFIHIYHQKWIQYYAHVVIMIGVKRFVNLSYAPGNVSNKHNAPNGGISC